jgi:antitoxin MazE
MLVNVIQIGNSKGLRIPKSVLKQCNIQDKVEMEIDDDTIVIKALKKDIRKNWDKAFKDMHNNKDDQLYVDDSVDVEMEDWEW